MSPERILVLDGSTTEGLACVRSLGRAGHWVAVAAKRRWPLASWSRYCRASFPYRRETVEAFTRLRAWAHKKNVRVVLPLTEATNLLCNAERTEWEGLGIIVGCAPDPVLACAFDKAETLRHAQACDVEIPPTRYPSSLKECHEAAAALGYPCVVKPRFTSAWNGNGFYPDLGPAYAKNPAELDAAVRLRRQGEYWPLIQGFVPGQGKGVFTVCDQGRPIAWFAHERLRDIRPTGSGSSLRRSVALDPRLRDRAERLLRQIGWHGPAMVEFRDDGIQAPWLMEVNGRFWGSLHLSVIAGRDFPRLWTEILTGRESQAPGTYRVGVTLRWLWGDFQRFLYILAGRPRGYPGTYPSVSQGLRELFGHQPPGTQLEAWDPHDPWPAVGEWVEGAREVFAKALRPR
jgi:predicted ATP-grasp superfamily ATP-dependent carboligase